MSEWWSYTLGDFLLFSPRTYYRLFELYNADLWPAHLGAFAAGIAIMALLLAGGRKRSGAAALLLGVCWLWIAWGFLYTRYATINWAAPYAAALFAAEAALLALACALGRKAGTGGPGPVARRVGVGLLAFALLGYPWIGPMLGRGWPQAEIFALAPDPTALATLGFALLAGPRMKWVLMGIPILWCAASGATLWAMEAPDAVVLPAAAFLALAAGAADAVFRRRGAPPPEGYAGRLACRSRSPVVSLSKTTGSGVERP